MHESIATTDIAEFINLQPFELNPLMSACEIKVLYVGQNRNHSFISKDTAAEMSKTLRGCPIVGYYKEDKQDFGDHGQRVTIDDEGIHFECLTRPYGFVAPDAKVWFQKFKEFDAFGNQVIREYLMTTGYLWTGQFEECAEVLKRGTNQSMELDDETLKGEWATSSKTGIEFFVINDATFSKLCILGEDVEPCFEGASVKAPEVSSRFSLDNNFKITLFSMMQDLKNALGGESIMDELNLNEPSQEFELEQNAEKEEELIEIDTPAPEFKKNEDEDEEKESASDDDKENKDVAEDQDEKEDDEDSKKKYALLEQELAKVNATYAELVTEYAALESKYLSLVEFKNQIEDAKKDELINSFYMLSDEDKQDVIENKRNYSLDDIEAKLSVICVRKRISFAQDEQKKEPVIFSLADDVEESIPAWIRAVDSHKKATRE